MKNKNGQGKRIPWTPAEMAVRCGIIGFVLLLASLSLWFSFAGENGSNELKVGSDLTLPLADLKPGKLLLFRYPMESSAIAQLAVQRGKDSVIRVSFAACRGCWRFHHYEWFGKVICGRCGHAIALRNPGEAPIEGRGCVSVAIPYSIETGRLVVRAQDITNMFHRWFQASTAKR